MNISPIKPGTVAAPSSAGDKPHEWRVGAILAARVIRRRRNGRLLIDIDGRRFETDSSAGTSPDDQLTVRVAGTSRHPVLRILSEVPDASIRAQLRAALPRQLAWAGLLADLGYLARHAEHSPLVPEANDLIKHILQALSSQIIFDDAQALREALFNSGFFLEAKLAAGNDTPTRGASLRNDWKANLLRLRGLLRRLLPSESLPRTFTTDEKLERDTPPLWRHAQLSAQPRVLSSLSSLNSASEVVHRLNGQIEGALARLDIAQLSSHSSETPAMWLIELPIHVQGGVDIIQFKIEFEACADDEPDRNTWTISLSLAPPGLGTIHARITLQEKRASVTLWAAQAVSATRLVAQLTRLTSRLEVAHLTVIHIACHPGLPSPPVAGPSGLFDAHA